jgi:hypothetical protein
LVPTPAPEKELIEVVAVPFEGVTAPESLVYEGVRYNAEIKSGFAHYKVPLKYAEVLLSDTSCGWPYRLVGREEPLVVKRWAGQHAEGVVVYPHVLDKTSKGEAVWKPVIVEESEDVED